MKWEAKQCWRRVHNLCKKIFTCSDAHTLTCIAENVSLMFLKEEGAEAHKCGLAPFRPGRGKSPDQLSLKGWFGHHKGGVSHVRLGYEIHISAGDGS